MHRRLAGALALAGGGFAGYALVRRARGGRRERVDLYYEDGTLVSLDEAEGAPLLQIAHDALRG